MRVTLKDLKKLSGVEFLNKDLIKPIKGVSIDSRKINENEIFFAIKGENFDGHNFVDEVFSKGASVAVIENTKKDKFLSKGYPLIIVPDTIKALGELANIYRKKFKVKVIGLTGSNGKTTTKEMIAKVLASKFTIIKTEGNLNNTIGVPLNLFRLNNKHELAVIELGINNFGEMKTLCEIAEPDFGLITNIGHAHIEFLKSRENIAKEKGELFQFLKKKKGFVFVNNDEPLIKNQARGINRKLSFGFGAKSDVKGKIISLNEFAQPTLQVSFKGKSELINLQTYGIHTAENALCAVAVGLKFGISLKQIKKELETFQSYDKRMQIINVGKYTIINDAYNANPDSMKMAIQTLGLMNGYLEKLAVLGDMLELGEFSEKFHRELAHYLSESQIKKVFFFGELTKASFDEAKKMNLIARHFESKKELVDEIIKSMPEGSLILLKGSRKMKMEEIIEFLKG